MNGQYNPDKWLLFKVGGTDPHYRVFGAWSGGYLGSDEWRMNSGVVRVEEDETHYHFYGSTGSRYTCNKEMYGSTAYGWGVAQSYEDNDRLTIINKPDNIMDMDWIIGGPPNGH